MDLWDAVLIGSFPCLGIAVVWNWIETRRRDDAHAQLRQQLDAYERQQVAFERARARERDPMPQVTPDYSFPHPLAEAPRTGCECPYCQSYWASDWQRHKYSAGEHGACVCPYCTTGFRVRMTDPVPRKVHPPLGRDEDPAKWADDRFEEIA